MSICVIEKRRKRIDSVASVADLEDSIFIFENCFGRVVEYIVAAIIRDKDGVTYCLDTYDESGNLVHYRTLDQKEIGTTAFLDQVTAEASAQKHKPIACSAVAVPSAL